MNIIVVGCGKIGTTVLESLVEEGHDVTAVDNRIACLEQRTGAYHVFVCDPFEPYEYVDVVTLEGMTVADGEKVSVDYVLGEDGVLTVTYPTADGDKTVTISLNAPEE